MFKRVHNWNRSSEREIVNNRDGKQHSDRKIRSEQTIEPVYVLEI
jgi:hypothetical protein